MVLVDAQTMSIMQSNEYIGTIAVEGIEVFGYHGVYPQERVEGNAFVVDVYLEAPVAAAASRDDLAETVDYAGVYQLVLEMMNESTQLLETLTVRIGEEILRRFSPVLSARVRVAKLRPMAMEQCERTYVELRFVR
jgi:dihydroneopterin aldolase